MSGAFSLTPGFSPVPSRGGENRFNGFLAGGKPLKRLVHSSCFFTQLKPGVNKMGNRRPNLGDSTA
jgi:hypothetical protein